MKNFAALLLLVAALVLGAAPQVRAQKQRFDLQPFGLISAQTPDKAPLHLGQSYEDAVRALGNPSSTDREFAEFANAKLDVLYYNRNKLYFLDGALINFELHDNTLVFGKTYETAFCVGAKITAETNPDGSPTPPEQTRYLVNNTPVEELKVADKPGKTANISYKLIARGPTKMGDTKSDGMFEMLFDARNKLVYIGLRD